ncbi:hypothetical protein F4779DRAFT_487143 [Xylariaceae sp. FL0662B]|nr:hypothetical protein F4779DRAFT_487143 [Xylariaceae sp. FL0662B]
MAPIPVYTNSPISAEKPSGVTPQTAPVGDQPSSISKPTTSTSSPTSSHQSFYPPAQPGAAPSLPTPTTAAQAYSPSDPSPTQTLSHDSPPPPQPGAVPVPFGRARTDIPPPPKVGEKYRPPQQTPAPQPVAMPYPHQMSVPVPTAAYPSQQSGTSVAQLPSSAYGSHRLVNPEGLDHPPGYHQNTNASELDRYQRSAVQQSDFGARPDDSDGVWGAAKKWAQHTGERLAAAESEVWKKINKE